MGWAGLSLVTDAEIGQLEPQATASGSPWGQVTWSDARTLAKRDLKVWLEIAYPTVPGVADRVQDRWKPTAVFGLTGGTATDISVAARDAINQEDVDLATIFTTTADDRLYVGASWEFDGVAFRLLDSLNANASVLTGKYWGPAGWTAFTGTSDGTIVSAGKTFSGTGRYTWTVPSDWRRRTLYSSIHSSLDEFYWAEFSVSAALTAGTAATQILTVKAPDGLKTVAQYLALMHIFRGLAAQAPSVQMWLDRASDYENRARGLFTELKEGGGIPLDIDQDDAIDAAIEGYQPQVVRLARG